MRLPEPSRLPEPLDIPGLPVPLSRRLKRVPPWMWFIIAIGIIPIASLPAIALARYSTSSSAYCLTCHSSGETLDRGVRSLAHPGFDKTTCVDCHAKPNQVVFEGYLKGFMAEPERVNQNCLRCHGEMVGKSDQAGFKVNFGNIKVPHKPHVDRGATCVTCHFNIAHDLEERRSNRPRMETCYQCHARADSCNKCHVTPPPGPLPTFTAPAVGVAAQGREVYLMLCSACHGPKGNQIPQADLTSSAFLEKRGEAAILRSIEQGKGVMPPFGKIKGGELTQEQIQASMAYIKAMASPPYRAPDMESLYNAKCLVCHGADGNKVAGAPLGSKAYLSERSDAQLFEATARGVGGMPGMHKSKGGTLDDAEIKGLVKYMRSLAERQ